MTPRTRALALPAALTAAVLALAACSDGGSSDAAPTTSPTATTTGSPDPEASEAPTGASTSVSSAGEAARAFVQAVSDGDGEAAFALLAPGSQEAAGGPEGVAERRAELPEGFDALAGADPQVVRTALGDGTGVVTLFTDDAAVTLPYREQEGGVVLDPFDRSEAAADFRTPEPGGSIEAGGELIATIPGGLEPVVSVDGQQFGVEQTADGDVLQLRTVAPNRLDPAAPHALTVAWTDEDGRIGGDAAVFTVG